VIDALAVVLAAMDEVTDGLAVIEEVFVETRVVVGDAETVGEKNKVVDVVVLPDVVVELDIVEDVDAETVPELLCEMTHME
jgi:hypothetical protein